jgi:hypothetical protein
MAMWPVAQPSVPDVYYQALMQFPPEIQMLVIQSRQLEQGNPRAAKRLLVDNPQVVMARKTIAEQLTGGYTGV